jgi:hypothetical protein
VARSTLRNDVRRVPGSKVWSVIDARSKGRVSKGVVQVVVSGAQGDEDRLHCRTDALWQCENRSEKASISAMQQLSDSDE